MYNAILKRFTICAGALLLLTPVGAWASAGKAIFVYGSASVLSEDGNRQALQKGDSVDSGDTIVTAANGRVQIQLTDGGLLALRPSTEFKIERYHYPAAAATQSSALSEEPASFFALIKGGFRSITGAIGRTDKAAYRVRTPVATIGIRGTDYDALLCAGDCQAVARATGGTVEDGLYIGVNSGGVRVSNAAGAVDLDVNGFGFAAGSRSAPVQSDKARDVLAPATTAAVNAQSLTVAADPADVSPDTGVAASDASGDGVSLDDGASAPADNSGAVAYSNLPGEGVGVTAQGAANAARTASGSVSGFDADDARFDSGSTQMVNEGRDVARTGATGLSWGRWSQGDVNVTDGSVTSTASVADSVHWVAGADDAPTPQLPTTGTQSFDLIGNTDPTDNRGNVGTLGSATLDANFDTQTVDADVSLSFAETNEVWDASATGVDINSGDATFDGEFDTVTVTDGSGTTQGSGDLSGFFTGNDAGDVTGAGMTFGLSDDAGTDVSGSAAFQARPGGN